VRSLNKIQQAIATLSERNGGEQRRTEAGKSSAYC